MSGTVEAGGVALAIDDRGAGPAVVLVHGAAAGRSVWDETVAALGDGVRTVAYDRRAYGSSSAPEPYTGTTVGEQADDLAEVLRSLGLAPAVLVGHALGAMIALDVALRFPDLVRGAVLLEPPVLWLSPRGPEVVGDLRDAIEQGARDEGPGGAVESYLSLLGGADGLDLLGKSRLSAARSDARAFAADLVAGPSWTAARREFRAISAPIRVVSGWRSPAVYREVSAALVELLPSARLVELEAGHFAMLEQPEAVAEEALRLVG
jgi:pimeloyl-ACP methyl ester carboxylesterase